MSLKAIGEVRPSQVITTFGPGAIVDLQTLSVVVAGIDAWPQDIDLVIREPRLSRALGVEHFLPAKPSEGSFYNRRGTVPTYIFPRFQVCPVCQTLSEVGGGDCAYDPKWREIVCKATGCPGKAKGKHQASTVPAPFVVACASGHLDDFPWRVYAHRGPTTCRKRMKLYSNAESGTVQDIMISCECGSGTRSAGDAFGEDRATALGQCSRRRPWLGLTNHDPASCDHTNDVRALQRGATNGWFGVVRSALAVKEAASPIGIALNQCDPRQIAKIDTVEKLQTLITAEMFPALEPFEVGEVWAAIKAMRGEVEANELDLRWPEWVAFRQPGSAGDDKGELFLEAGTVPPGFSELITAVTRARKLLEVRALVGFSRIDTVPTGIDGVPQRALAPICREPRAWRPAVQVRGEGIFIELNEKRVATWEQSPPVAARAMAMAQKYAEWQAERKATPALPFPGARYVLLHTLAHLVIRQLSLDCGYSASSVRERIYSSSDPARRMAGILLYTASADSEGSLGGLVDLGSPQRFPTLLRAALRSAARCSSDPLCADHQPDVHATINAAACHACVLASETSCESFNRFLDRNVVVPTMAHNDFAYFPSALIDAS